MITVRKRKPNVRKLAKKQKEIERSIKTMIKSNNEQGLKSLADRAERDQIFKRAVHAVLSSMIEVNQSDIISRA